MKCEFEVPPHTKVRVVAVVDSRLKDEMELIHEAECKLAEECDREVPDWSNTLEMIWWYAQYWMHPWRSIKSIVANTSLPPS